MREEVVFYSTFPMREQAEKGEWNYEVKEYLNNNSIA